MFILCPVSSLPLIILEIYNKRDYAVWLMIVFLCLIALYFPPAGDLFRYYRSYQFISLEHYYPAVLFYLTDTYLFNILFLLGYLNIPFQYFNFITCLIQLSVIYYLLKKNGIDNMNLSATRLCIILGSFVFTSYFRAIELRNYTAIIVFLLALDAYYNRKNLRKYVIFSFFATLIHLSILPISIVLPVLTKVCGRIKKYKIFILSFVVYFLLLIIVNYLELLGFSKVIYVTEAVNANEENSFLLKFFKYVIAELPFYFFLVLVISANSKSRIYECCLLILGFIISTLSFPDLCTRMRYLFTSVSWLYFAGRLHALGIIWKKAFVMVSAIALLGGVGIYYRTIMIAEYKNLFLPLPVSLTSAGYSETWINERIDNGAVENIK